MIPHSPSTPMLLLAIAGAAAAASDTTPALAEPNNGRVQHVAHIYYNAITGERVATLADDHQTAPADTGASVEIWSSQVRNTCVSEGYNTSDFYFALDNAGSSSLSYGATLLDYADIALDTVVDCIQVNWVVAHPDTDDNSDGVGDGVEELAGEWRVWDADNGRESNFVSTRLPLVDFLFYNLPGNTPLNQQAGSLSEYTMDVDLVSFGSTTDLSFEIGDSDGDCQTAAFCNNDLDTNSDGFGDGVSVANVDRDFDGMLDSDLDGDGYFDWSWSVRFYQPGTGNDFDSDSNTGVAQSGEQSIIGVAIAAPAGTAIDNLDGTWSWDIDTSIDTPGFGQEDRYALYNPPNSTGGVTYNGGYWFGGFACTGGLISTGGSGYTPPAMFKFSLYGPQCACGCRVDLNGDGQANFFDVSLFIQDYNAGGDYNGDGSTNFFDISQFIQDFNSGCP